MSTLTPSQIINLWWTHEQIRKSFKTLGAFQDYQLNPSESRYTVILSPSGKLSLSENPAPQKRHKYL
jgi:hypothetical protein